ncbi:haloacid dehalogenase-like hydrolase [Roseibium hamelinense]|uniref:Haloacid dehalogenase-like hydrolase n=1 Tax=Roseibium hamelinense TaxID=150831 RepID=A0A562TIG6_9HYPH|nr:HAD family hydrolase [Roseibium hamelinense]MTI42756.1 haloacid dehalogenase-like hydrolase [Roseibium hamelinense]TWI93402.1 haloacid dehalogenase-like hydrolase [Roseibium hamelinense]
MRLAILIFAFAFSMGAALADPLPSWRDGEAKSNILSFVREAVQPGNPAYIVPAERIAVFDNDGTLWAEQPFYFQLAYAIDRVGEMAKNNPDMLAQNPVLEAAAEGDMQGVLASGHDGLLDVIAASHSGMTTGDFKQSVGEWLASARHPTSGQRYHQMVYQPMIELLVYLRDNDFKTYIVSGGGIDFIRVFSEQVYGIPPEQVIGSSIRSEFQVTETTAETVKLPELFFYDDKAGKPVAINHHIGRRPVFAGGNSDGDHQMLQYTDRGGDRPGFALLIHHTDAEREWAYDKGSTIGGLDNALTEARERGWTVVDMKNDWRTVFSFQLGAQ